MKILKRLVLILIAGLMLSADNGVSHKIFVIGDSTASIYTSGYYPRTGWAQILQAFFNSEDIEVVDKAMSGRSSKSFYTDPDGWVTVVDALSEGDYLFIQFGHNDQKDDERFTDPYTSYQEYLSIYIDSARAIGTIPVLLTSIHRNGWNNNEINDSHGDYPPAMRALATEKNVPLIDLHAKTKTMLESFGPDYCTNHIFNNLPAGVWVNYPNGNEDNTHIQENGAFEVCKLVAEGITELDSISEIAILKNALTPAGRISAMPNPNLSAKITGRGVYSIGANITLSAVGEPGHAFDNWTEADTIFSDSASFTMTLTDTLREFTANTYQVYNVTLKQLPAFYGILKGYGYYKAGSEVTIIATPKQGYQFIDWKKNKEIITTDSLFTFTMEEVDVTYTATFEPLPVSVNEDEMMNVSIYPNPNKGYFTIIGTQKGSKIEIYDLKGELIFSTQCTENNQQININLNQGVYLLKNSNNNKTKLLKFIVK